MPVCGSVLELAVPAWRYGDTSPGALWGDCRKDVPNTGVQRAWRTARDCGLQSARRTPQAFKLCPGLHEIHHTSRHGMTPITEYEFGSGRGGVYCGAH